MITNTSTRIVTEETANIKERAIKAALTQNWQEALRLNHSILEVTPDDVETKNRLAKAYCELGEAEKSVKIYQEVLALDPYNQIASKNAKLLSKVSGKINGKHTNGNSNGVSNGHTNGSATQTKVDFNIFLSEPGKTKIINLVHLATPRVLSTLSSGDRLTLVSKRHAIQLIDEEGEYVGALPDDMAHLLIKFITGGNKYEAYVKKITANSLWVILWEKLRAKKFTNQPSFSTNGKVGYIPFVRQESVRTEPLEISLDSDEPDTGTSETTELH